MRNRLLRRPPCCWRRISRALRPLRRRRSASSRSLRCRSPERSLCLSCRAERRRSQPSSNSEVCRTALSAAPSSRRSPTGLARGAWQHDVGPCVQSAINAAGASGGGEVVVPCGRFGQSTPITQPFSGVALVGCGIEAPRDSINNQYFLAATTFVWIGASNATMIDVEPTGTSTEYAASVIGIAFDCNSIAQKCFMASHVSRSVFKVGGAEAVTSGGIDVLFTTKSSNGFEGPGTQDNDIWAYARSLNNASTGIMYSGGITVGPNFSYDRIHSMQVNFENGDGIVFGWFDNTIVDDIRTFRFNTSGTGNPVAIASTGYVSPNGVGVTSAGGQLIINHVGSPMYIGGYQDGTSITTNSANSCNGGGSAACGFDTIALTTSGTTATKQTNVTFSSTTGVLPGMTVSCTGGSGSGLMPMGAVRTVPNGTTLSFYNTTIASVANGVACTGTYGFTAQATPGLYTITAVDGTHLSITAPAGTNGHGHSQSNIAVAGSVITFTDFVSHVFGTFTTGDSWTITAGTPPTQISAFNIDEGNNISNPTWQCGSYGASSSTLQPFAQLQIGCSTSGSYDYVGSSVPNLYTGSFASHLPGEVLRFLHMGRCA